MKAIKRLATIVALISAGMSALLLVKNRAPRGFMLWIPKVVAGALEPFFGAAGLVSAVLGAISGSWLALLAGLFSLRSAWDYLTGIVIRPQMAMFPRFDQAFGPEWEKHLTEQTTPAQRDGMLPYRWSWLAAQDPEPRILKDVPFWTEPETGRTLLCDIWLPPEGVPQTGLGMVYFHGSAWYLGDKDFGTRAFFRHLAAQGCLVMDAQYRLSPETDMFGMIHDVKHAIAWLKAHAAQYGVDPRRILAAGASAGGQLAMLAAYAPDHPRLTPPDLMDTDLTVRGVVSYYGPCDLAAVYYHTNQQLTPLELAQTQPANSPMAQMMAGVMRLFSKGDAVGEAGAAGEAGAPDKTRNMAMAGRLEPVMGGSPAQVRENYILASPITHVSQHSPATFLVQGEDDLIVPVDANRQLYQRLSELNIPVINLVFPHVDHGFDLLFPRTSPPAQSALYELDRFLALM